MADTPDTPSNEYAPDVRFFQPAVMLVGAGMYVAIYAALMQSDDSSADPSWIFLVAGAWNLLLLGATVVAAIDAVRRVRAGLTRQLALDAMVVKLASVPFFVLNFAILLLLLLAGIALIFLGPVLWTIVAVGACLTYLAMLSTSIPSWATILQLRRSHVIGTTPTVLYSLMSAVFVLDIPAGMLLFGHSRGRPRLALLWLLLAAGLALIALAPIVAVNLLDEP